MQSQKLQNDLCFQGKPFNITVIQGYAPTGEGNGTALQYSCLENPRDEGAWWAAVYGVAQSRTRLKQLSSSSSQVFLDFLLLHSSPL